MKLFDYFRSYNELIEILIGGSNPQATRRLPHAEVDVLRNHLGNDERIRAFAQGRSVGEGRTVWVATSQALLVLRAGSTPVVDRVPLAEIQHVDIEEGRYGHALRVSARGLNVSVYGLARAHAVLSLRALQPTASGDATLSDDEANQALHDTLDLQMRAQPVLAQAEAETQQLLAQAAARARAEGLLKASEATA